MAVSKQLWQKILWLEIGLQSGLGRMAKLANELQTDAQILADLEEKMAELRLHIQKVSTKVNEIEEKLALLRK